jgi:hypothetical protein
VVIFITLLAGSVPLLQVTFITLLEDYLSGLTRCERSGQKLKDHRRNPKLNARVSSVDCLICGVFFRGSLQISLFFTSFQI